MCSMAPLAVEPLTAEEHTLFSRPLCVHSPAHTPIWTLPSKSGSGNIQGDSRKFLGHFIHHFRSQISESSKQNCTKPINPNFATEMEFYHVCPSVCVCFFQTVDLDLVSESGAHFRSADICKTIDCVLGTHPFTDCNQSHFCCEYWLHSLYMTLFEWFWRCMCPKIAFKMSRGISDHLLGYYPES